MAQPLNYLRETASQTAGPYVTDGAAHRVRSANNLAWGQPVSEPAARKAVATAAVVLLRRNRTDRPLQ